MKYLISAVLITVLLMGCESETKNIDPLVPKEIIDLGAVVTEDLPDRVWGGFMKLYGFSENNTFDVIERKFEFPDGSFIGSNSYYKLFNHGGPHVDAPKHVGFSDGLDKMQLESFVGPLKIIDASNFPPGRSVPLEEIQRHDINAGDIVILYTAYKLPLSLEEIPERVTVTQEAAEYLAELPVRAIGTDAYNVESDDNPTPVNSTTALQRVAPIHYTFLSRGIPIFEQLFNVNKLLGKDRMYFVGQPLNIKDGDGMMVRPVVLVYE